MTATASLFVCTGCLDAPDHFIAAFRAHLTGSGCTVKPVECLAVCERPATLSLTGHGKWTYLLGNILPEVDLASLVETARAYASSPNGIIPMDQRPLAFRDWVIARSPPPEFEMP